MRRIEFWRNLFDNTCAALYLFYRLMLGVLVCILVSTPVAGLVLLQEYFQSPSINLTVQTARGVYEYTDTCGECPTNPDSRYTIVGPKGYEPTRLDTCINCHDVYRQHHHLWTEEQKKRYDTYFQLYLNRPHN